MEIAFLIGCISGIIVIGAALISSFNDNNDHWRYKG
jgi:hypothetical protein